MAKTCKDCSWKVKLPSSAMNIKGTETVCSVLPPSISTFVVPTPQGAQMANAVSRPNVNDQTFACMYHKSIVPEGDYIPSADSGNIVPIK